MSSEQHILMPSRVSATINLALAIIALIFVLWVPIAGDRFSFQWWGSALFHGLIFACSTTLFNMSKEEFRAAADLNRTEAKSEEKTARFMGQNRR